MDWILLGALIVGFCLLVFGYIRNNRNLLATAAILLVASAGGKEFVTGFQEGYSGASSTGDQPVSRT